jgi:type VI secretion system secreted protein VgrG
MDASKLLALIGNRSVFTFDVEDYEGALRVVRFTGEEGLSRIFEYTLEIASDDAELDDFVGKTGVLTIEGPDEPRFVHGFIRHAEYVGESRNYPLHELVLVPHIWRLQNRHDCRIFQELRTPDIVQQVLVGAGVPTDRFRFDLNGAYTPRNYCVQYRETDLDFISRLLEEDGIFYFFEHSMDRHVLVMADQPGAHPAIAGDPVLWFNPPGGLVNDREHIDVFRFSQSVRPGRVSLRDFYFPNPDARMEVTAESEFDPELEVYDYPGEYRNPERGAPERGATIARTRLEALQASRRLGAGNSDCMRLVAGHTFTMQAHPADELNRAYKLVRVVHHATQPQVLGEDAAGDFSYHNEFVCMERSVPFRPARATPRPFVRGIQSATVVGPAGEEIHTDEQGRVKVQFHWDRVGTHDEHSSCWIRVSQLWAGAGWGAMFLPRIGHEVLVDFIEGDPDRPIITGRVYHGLNDTPYPLPQEKTRSTIKSDSSLGGGGFNEFRFEDRKGDEQVFLHAERNLDIWVKRDRIEAIRRDRHLIVGDTAGGKAGTKREAVLLDKHVKVHRHEHRHNGGDVYLHIGGGDGDGNHHVTIEANQHQRIDKDAHLHVKGKRLVKVGGKESHVVESDSHSYTRTLHAIEAGQELHLKAPKIVIEATTAITIKAPGGFITIDAGGVAVQGTHVRINSGGAALDGSGASPDNAVDPKPANPLEPVLADRGG